MFSPQVLQALMGMLTQTGGAAGAAGVGGAMPQAPAMTGGGGGFGPSWLAGLTGGQKFANNPANNFQPTLGDHLQGIGHDMMQHYRGQAFQDPNAPTQGIAGGMKLGQKPIGPQVSPYDDPVLQGQTSAQIAAQARAPTTPLLPTPVMNGSLWGKFSGGQPWGLPQP